MLVRRFAPIALLALGLALPAAAHAQASLGLKLGPSFATLSNKAPDWDNRNGFAAGVAFDLRAGAIGIQPEALYVQKGVSLTGAPSSSAPKLDYLELPVLVKLTIPTEGVQPMVYAGPAFSFRLSCTFGDLDCSDQVKDTDYGVAAGAGLRFGGARGFTVEGRYTWGLQDINDLGAGVRSRTRTFLILGGISL